MRVFEMKIKVCLKLKVFRNWEIFRTAQKLM